MPVRRRLPMALAVATTAALLVAGCRPAPPDQVTTATACGANWQALSAGGAVDPGVNNGIDGGWVVNHLDGAADGSAFLAGQMVTRVGDDPVDVPVFARWTADGWVVSPSSGYQTSNAELDDVVALGAASAVAVGRRWVALGTPQSYTIESRPMIVTWDGTRVTQVPGLPGTDVRLQAVDATSAADVWAAGVDHLDRPYVLHSDGASWTEVAVPYPAGRSTLDVVGLVATAPNDAWLVVDGYPTGGGPHIPSTFHWDGAGWSDVPAPAITLARAVVGSADGQVVVLGQQGSTPVAARRTATGWAALPAPPVVPTAGLAGAAGDLWIAGQGTTQHWDGATWAGIRNPVAPSDLTQAGDVQIAATAQATSIRCASQPVYPHPAPPTGVRATVTSTSATVTWVHGASTSNVVGSRVTLTRADGEATTTTIDGKATTTTFTGLTPGATYHVGVTTKGWGGDSDPSAPTLVAPPSTLPGDGRPAAPYGVEARWSAPGTIVVTWIAPARGSQGIDDYDVVLGGVDPQDDNVGGTSATFSGIATYGSTYPITVVANSGAGRSDPSVSFPLGSPY